RYSIPQFHTRTGRGSGRPTHSPERRYQIENEQPVSRASPRRTIRSLLSAPSECAIDFRSGTLTPYGAVIHRHDSSRTVLPEWTGTVPIHMSKRRSSHPPWGEAPCRSPHTGGKRRRRRPASRTPRRVSTLGRSVLMSSAMVPSDREL